MCSLNQRTRIFLEELQLSQNFVYAIRFCYYTPLLLCILFRQQFFFHIMVCITVFLHSNNLTMMPSYFTLHKFKSFLYVLHRTSSKGFQQTQNFLCDSVQTKITDYVVQMYNKYNLLITTKAYWHFYNKHEHMLVAHRLKQYCCDK